MFARWKEVNESMEYFTVKQIANRFNTSVTAVYNLFNHENKKLRLGFTKIGKAYRVHRNDLEDYERRNHFPVKQAGAF